MGRCGDRIALGHPPARRPCVKIRMLRRPPRVLRPQVGRHQRRDAERGGRCADLHDEPGIPGQPVQYRARVRPAGESGRQPGRNRPADADCRQHLPISAREPGEELADEEVGHRAGVRREPLQELIRIGLAAQGGTGQTHTCRPAAGTGVHLADLRRGQPKARSAQERAGLLRGEAQLVDANLAQVARGSEPAQRQRRVRATAQQEAQPGGPGDQERLQALQRCRSDEFVDVVQDQRDPHWQRVERLDDIGREPRRGPRRHGRAAELVERGVRRHDAGGRDGGEDVQPEPARVVVGPVNVGPDDSGAGRLGRPGPVRQQRGLTEPGRGADEPRQVVAGVIQRGEQPRARHERFRESRNRPAHVRIRHHGRASRPGPLARVRIAQGTPI